MVRINEYGEIVRDGSPPTSRVKQPTPSPSPPTASPNPVQRMVILGTVLFALLGGLAGYGAGARWFATEVPETGKWNKGVKSIAYSVHVASWSSHPVHHKLQDVTVPLRILLVIAAAVGILIAVFSDGWPAGEGEGWGVFFIVVGVVLLGTALAGAVFRLLVWLLAYPVTWFVNDLTSPVSGMLAVGLVWAVLGALVGLVVGGCMAASEG